MIDELEWSSMNNVRIVDMSNVSCFHPREEKLIYLWLCNRPVLIIEINHSYISKAVYVRMCGWLSKKKNQHNAWILGTNSTCKMM